MNKKDGFTLAEVLITLSILGVVAAISIPNLIQQYQKRLTITKLQKAYAVLEQASSNLAINTGCMTRDIACTGLLDIENQSEIQNKFFELTGMKVVNMGKPVSRGMYLACENPNNICNHTQGTFFGNYIYSVSKDNIGYIITKHAIHTSNENTGKDIIAPINGFAITVFTDAKAAQKLKGLKNGRNTFYFVMYDNFQVEPLVLGHGGSYFPMSKLGAGINWLSESSLEGGCNPDQSLSAHSGEGCAAKIIKDGWKMNY